MTNSNNPIEIKIRKSKVKTVPYLLNMNDYEFCETSYEFIADIYTSDGHFGELPGNSIWIEYDNLNDRIKTPTPSYAPEDSKIAHRMCLCLGLPKGNNIWILFRKADSENAACFYFVRKKEEVIKAQKEAKALLMTKATFKKLLKENADNLMIKRNYCYTDDYAWDSATNFGKYDFRKLEEGELEDLINTVSSSCYTVSGKKTDNIIKLFSSWQSFDIKLRNE